MAGRPAATGRAGRARRRRRTAGSGGRCWRALTGSPDWRWPRRREAPGRSRAPRPRSRPCRRAARGARRPASTIVTSFCSESKPMSAREMSFTTIASSALRSSFSRARSTPSGAVLGGEPDQRSARAGAARASLGQHVRRCAPARPRARSCASLAIFPSLRARPAGSRRPPPPSAARRSPAKALERARCAAPRRSRRPHMSTPGAARQRDVGRDDRHPGAPPRRLRGEREAHPAAGAVAEVAHRVERLACPARGDQHAQAVERARRPGAGRQLDRGQQLGAARRAGPRPTRRARRARPCRGPPRARRARAASRRFACVAGMLVHAVVHRRRDAARGSCRRGRRRSACCPRGPPASLAIVFAVAGAMQYDVAARGQLEMADRVVVGRRLTRDTRRAPGRARTRSTSTGAPVIPSNVARPTNSRLSRRLDHAHRVAGLASPGAPARPPCRRRCRRSPRAGSVPSSPALPALAARQTR